MLIYCEVAYLLVETEQLGYLLNVNLLYLLPTCFFEIEKLRHLLSVILLRSSLLAF